MGVENRARAVAVGLAVAVLALAGCGGGPDATGGPVTLEFWAWG